MACSDWIIPYPVVMDYEEARHHMYETVILSFSMERISCGFKRCNKCYEARSRVVCVCTFWTEMDRSVSFTIDLLSIEIDF